MQVSHNAQAVKPEMSLRERPEPKTPPGSLPDVRGRHRIRVELNRIQHEKQLLEEELQALQRAPLASVACKEMIEFMESRPDPFTSKPSAQLEAAWNRWFETPVDSTGCSCWSLNH